MNSLIRSIAVDPKTPQRVYAAGPAGLFRSDDGGLAWAAASKGLAGEPLAVALDPAAPQTVFAVLIDDSVWQSHDRATSWQALEKGQ
ncbi:MAG: hypothetical protein M1546_26665 [Chloroflexi bacterium]|nr:hypothetical protein [Chloroflexota bacterium]